MYMWVAWVREQVSVRAGVWEEETDHETQILIQSVRILDYSEFFGFGGLTWNICEAIM